jgi:carboxyl-terminal processing protease
MIFRLAISLLLVLFFSQSTHAVAPSPSHKQKTLEIIDTLNDRHFVDLAIDDNLSSRFLENYIEQLDPEKVFFLSSDIQEFNKKQFELDDELKQGINKTGFDIYQRYQQRLSERIAKLVKQLEEEYTSPPAFTKDESIIVDDELAQWPTTEAMADDIWRKRVKSYFLNQKLTGEAFKESREKLIKRYKDQQKRINKNTAEDIYEVYINAFTGLYDPHTNYFSPRTSESFSIRMSLSLEGIGAVLQSEDGYTEVIRIVTGGPADKQGELKASDKISAVAQGEDGELVNVIGWRLDEVVDLIRGEKGSIVRLEVVSKEAAGEVTKVIRIKRDKVKLEDQAAQKAILNLSKDPQKPFKVGVINIPTFYLDFEAYVKRDPDFRSTSKDVRRLIDELSKEDVRGIIVDLRNNGGGSLYEATAVTDLFIDQGPVVQRGHDRGQKVSDFSQERAYYKGPLVVLINRLSASASEIFAGAIQDYNRGIIVGSQSFGKGTVQTLVPLKTQGELKITESKFYRVSGDSTQHRGVIPDILMPELVDPEEIGESSYDTALAWSKTKPVRHGTYFSLEQLIPILSETHNQRIKADPGFIYLNERKSLLDKYANQKTLSLNEKVRLQQKEDLEEKTLAIENRLRKAKNLPIFKDYEEYKNDSDEKNKKRAATAGSTVIDAEDDSVLTESGYILRDYVSALEQIKKQLAEAK